MKYMPWRKPRKKNKTSEAPTNQTSTYPLSQSLEENINDLKIAFDYPQNFSLELRHVYITALQRNATVCFVDGAVDSIALEQGVIKPIFEFTTIDPVDETKEPLSLLTKQVLPAASVEERSSLESIIQKLLDGKTIILVEGSAQALSLDTIGFKHRPITEPKVENALRGPKEAFTESALLNRSLLRKYIRDANLQCEVLNVGKRSPMQVYILYIRDLANPQLVQQVKERIQVIDVDSVQTITMLEQHIEDRPYSLFPTILSTERPDRVASALFEGHIALLMDNSPSSLVAPATFWSFFHTGEDYYLRWINGNFGRILRVLAIYIALMTPAIYLAITTFHIEMLPTDLMLAIAATRERVPFPIIIEILFMEVSFEILREAGVRVPTVIGPTIGIVGALILGQAAVDANIVSPILVIVVALTGLASFAIPDVSLNYSVRMLRFAFLFASAVIGVFGIALASAFLIVYVISIKSFGVPYFAPLAPHLKSSSDLYLRQPVWKEWLRPMHLQPKDAIKQKKTGGN